MTSFTICKSSVFPWVKKYLWFTKKEILIIALTCILVGPVVLGVKFIYSIGEIYSEYGMAMQRNSLVAPIPEGTVTEVNSFYTPKGWKYSSMLRFSDMVLDRADIKTSTGKVYDVMIDGVTKEMMQGANVFISPVSLSENDPLIRYLKDKKHSPFIFSSAEDARSFYKVCFEVNGSTICGLGL